MLPKFSILLLSCLILGFSCTSNPSSQSEKAPVNATLYEYQEMTIPAFFTRLVENHLEDYYALNQEEYARFCKQNNLAISDSLNKHNYFTIKALQTLFTSKSASNCSKGDVLNIPYYWHWTEPNPRHKIHFTSNNKLLADTKPSGAFSKYNSYADIDRTPFLFLSDMVASKPKYYSETCDTFYTFGWCSEREMAFVALTNLLGFNGKVVAEGNHSWSEFIIDMKTKSNEEVYFKLKVDNTFNHSLWTKIRQDEIAGWYKYQGTSNLANWYNQKANSTTELLKIKEHIASKSAIQHIELKLVDYLNSNLH